MTREEAIEVLNTYDMSEDNDDTEFKSAIALVIKALEQKPNKSEWQHDHEILKAYSDGASAVLDEIRAEIEKEIVPKNSDQYDYEAKWQNLGLRMALKVIDKYKAEGSD